jgi:hypothetical protein
MNFEYIDKLIENCNLAKKAKPIKEFALDINDISTLDSIKNAIYIIEELNGNKQKTFEHLKNYKSKKERACPKLNKPSKIMYVGSSTTNLKKRIKEHIGDGSKRTYSLQLKHWFKGEYKITIKIYDDISRNVLQLVEDNLSCQLKPAFGKQGANNK